MVSVGSTTQGTRSATRIPARADVEVVQDVGGQLVVAVVGLEAQALVGLHRVGALVLQLVGVELVEQADEKNGFHRGP